MPEHRFIWLSLVIAGASTSVLAEPGDLKAMLEGVSKITAPGVPGPLCVFGDSAFPVVVGGAHGAMREPVVAAARMGKGRIVAFGHNGYFGTQALATDDTGRLMVNLVRWSAGAGGASAQGPQVGAHGAKELSAFLTEKRIKTTVIDGADWLGRLGECDVLLLNPHTLSRQEEFAAVRDFVEKGGGLIVSDTGWGWLQLNPGKSLLTDHAGNRLLAPAGIVWTDGTLEQTVKGGYDAQASPPELSHAGKALDLLVAQVKATTQPSKEQIAQAAWVVTRAAHALPDSDKLLLPRLRQLQQDSAAAAIPTRAKPLKADAALARVLLTLQVRQMKLLPPEKVQAHPAAAEFPGCVPADANRVAQTIEIDTNVPGWHSTGLYAAPGEVVTVHVPEAAAGKGLQVRIGAHSDTLWNLDSWSRVPEVRSHWPLDKPAARAASAFGGLIYVEVPGNCKVEPFPAKVSNAVEAPYYLAGRTSLDDWRQRIRNLPAPWAELATGKVILTVPSKVIRQLDNPDELMKFWDRILDACAELAARPLDRTRPERYVTDVQISAGYMHSGYPIMTHLDAAEPMVNLAKLSAGQWGLFHELGHNHQSGDWTFDGTGEVTENLFSLYVCDKVCGIPSARSHPAISQQARARTMKAYLAGGTDFQKWKSDPFLGLQMYMQLQEAFGWEPFKKVFAEYRDLPAGKRPRNDDEKRDQWMARFSRTAGKNLGPFFQAWGVPTSEKARASIADLPAWMPEGFPPK